MKISRNNNDLKPCPFCGGKAEYRRTAIDTKGRYCDAVYVMCPDCNTRTGRVLYDARKHPHDEEYAEVREAWNKRGEEKSEWISVSEKLPRRGRSVLLTDGKAVFEGGLTPSNKWLRLTAGIVEGVTHWRPMPEPPREAGQCD